mmetsp:Transcript_30648/g.77543  ORF Transcript_30648/g.77543 Transcript_30648/m.77543 type:complete len:216 (+) Transcript_30648:625-1272(+)
MGATVPTTSPLDTTSAHTWDPGTCASSTPKTNFSFQKGSLVLFPAFVLCSGVPAGPCTRTTAIGLLSPSTPWGRLEASMTAMTMRVLVPPTVDASRALVLLLTDRSGEGDRALSASACLRASAACRAARSAASSASRALLSCSSRAALSLSCSLAAASLAAASSPAASSSLTPAPAPGERGCSEMSRRRPSLRLPVACCSVLMVFPCLTKKTCSM